MGRVMTDSIPPPSDFAAPLPSAGPPQRAAVPQGHRGPTDEAVTDARHHLQAALAQVVPQDDPIIVGHMRKAYRLLGGRL